MSTFDVRIHRLEIEPHPNADRLELAVIGGYRAIVLKDQYRTGSLAAYIPEAAICPDDVIAELGLEGRLSGSKKNRVKAVRLRGALSQGLVYPITGAKLRDIPVAEGDDVMEWLGITKYEPPVPTNLAGEVWNAHGATLKYDIENIKRYPDAFQKGEQVFITEKLHGTWCCFGLHPKHLSPIVTSKGLSAKGLAFKMDVEANVQNLYIRAWHEWKEEVEEVRARANASHVPFYLLGEVYGRGVQDLHYGASKPEFRAFDIYVGAPGAGRYLSTEEFEAALGDSIPSVPILYRGAYSKRILDEFTDGKTTLDDQHIREGIVIRPRDEERVSLEFGRVILKSVSGDYLTRHGGTEFE